MKFISTIARYLRKLTDNQYVQNKIKAKNPNTFTEKHRNFDLLVIGEKYDVTSIIPEGKTFLQFDAPNRSLFASFLILQAKFSWLNEGKGKCIIICRKRNEESRSVSIFDIPFLHVITINKYKLRRQQSELKSPLLSHPLQVMNFFFGRKYDNSSVERCPLKEIEDFCAQRDIELEYRVINK
ncbi:MAG: hypothetical protein IJ155_09855 [Prevotella sp.]|nr:hypothetical protein [Prevotella sp.]